ncbi:MAG TPA: hypothetical protein VN816_00665 [Acidimicrobiales bacterium]|nr:hypothetical protein [Acidimicrobiales bacterium]
MTTDRSTYPPGEPVMIDLTERDTSSEACRDTGVEIGGCYGATASNSTGDEVWSSDAGPNSTPESCPAELTPTTIPGDFSTTGRLSWAQDVCTQPVTNDQPNPDCPQTPVPSGTYRITGYWTATTFASPPVTIDITSS